MSGAASVEALRVLPGAAPQKAFRDALGESGLYPLRATGIGVLQINVGKVCNQTCKHCHVDAGPNRRESMSRETAELCMRALERTAIPVVDITGGAPEINPNFRWLVERSKSLGRHVMDRCNLTILSTEPQRDLAEFLAAHEVEVVASLPYFQARETDSQRGDGVFDKSVEALRKLNSLGYGKPGSRLKLNLVYNPVGAFLPPAQKALEADFRRELLRRHGVEFHSLYTITNMPISRFLDFLHGSGNYDRYMSRLISSYNAGAAASVMCRSTLSVGWDGALYDCDFNQMVEMPVLDGRARHIRDFDEALLAGREIAVGQHCYGCTAGAGSSCTGTVA